MGHVFLCTLDKPILCLLLSFPTNPTERLQPEIFCLYVVDEVNPFHMFLLSYIIVSFSTLQMQSNKPYEKLSTARRAKAHHASKTDTMLSLSLHYDCYGEGRHDILKISKYHNMHICKDFFYSMCFNMIGSDHRRNVKCILALFSL